MESAKMPTAFLDAAQSAAGLSLPSEMQDSRNLCGVDAAAAKAAPSNLLYQEASPTQASGQEEVLNKYFDFQSIHFSSGLIMRFGKAIERLLRLKTFEAKVNDLWCKKNFWLYGQGTCGHR